MKADAIKRLEFIDGSYNTMPAANKTSGRVPSLRFYIKLIDILYNLGVAAKRSGLVNEQFLNTAVGILQALEGSGVVFEVSGIENVVAAGGPCVYMPNHMSVLETFVLPGFICPYNEMTFVIKESLTRYPVFKHIMAAMDTVVVNRVNPREDLSVVLTEGAKKLAGGKSMIIFPQSTRSVDFVPKTYNTMGIKLALRAQVPAIPVAVKSDAWEAGRVLKDFGKIDPSRKVYISFGRPMRIKNKGAEEHKESVEFITGMLEKWGANVLR
ncbi:MAG: 1-acyl-sn-glycerol-3-phosphate acyltransferase [Nitrospirae bacterium]|nr:1-acyl-sn-glycerol-3-phosphate acyltransferase [Nitrospirota bacterium]